MFSRKTLFKSSHSLVKKNSLRGETPWFIKSVLKNFFFFFFLHIYISICNLVANLTFFYGDCLTISKIKRDIQFYLYSVCVVILLHLLLVFLLCVFVFFFFFFFLGLKFECLCFVLVVCCVFMRLFVVFVFVWFVLFGLYLPTVLATFFYRSFTWKTNLKIIFFFLFPPSFSWRFNQVE